MIHLRRYFAWAGQGQESLRPTRACLRSAMRTMAAAVSAQYRGFSDVLYVETRRLLETHNYQMQTQTQATEALSLRLNEEILLELIQAWLLLAHYESLRMDERQAMLTAGRAFRLIQIARLYDIDAPDDDVSVYLSPATTSESEPEYGEHGDPDESFAEAEEKRRTFWLAFSFDRFLCWRNEWPLTLQEEMVSLYLFTYTTATDSFLNRYAHISRPLRPTFKMTSESASAFCPKPWPKTVAGRARCRHLLNVLC
jgi:hypothetical protein